jgi:hypothetical protein
MIIPVFVYTFRGRKARIVQVHFDGKNLVVRLTKHLDFEKENVDNIKLLLRWMMNEPIGNTRTFDSQEAFDDAKGARNCPAASARGSSIEAMA